MAYFKEEGGTVCSSCWLEIMTAGYSSPLSTWKSWVHPEDRCTYLYFIL